MKIVLRKGVRFVKFKSPEDRNFFLKACLDHLTKKPDFTKVAISCPKGMKGSRVIEIMEESDEPLN